MRITKNVAAVAVVVVGIVATATPASATIVNGVCESAGHETCNWANTSWAGGLYDNDNGTDGNLTNNYFVVSPAVAVNDQIESTYNYGVHAMKYYNGFDFSTFLWCTPSGFGYTSQGTANNKASSHQGQSGAGC